jgi:hypothetical protein
MMGSKPEARPGNSRTMEPSLARPVSLLGGLLLLLTACEQPEVRDRWTTTADTLPSGTPLRNTHRSEMVAQIPQGS